MLFVWLQVLHPYSSTDTATTWKESRLILSERLDIHMIETMTNVDYVNDLALRTNTPAQAESLLHNLE